MGDVTSPSQKQKNAEVALEIDCSACFSVADTIAGKEMAKRGAGTIWAFLIGLIALFGVLRVAFDLALVNTRTVAALVAIIVGITLFCAALRRKPIPQAVTAAPDPDARQQRSEPIRTRPSQKHTQSTSQLRSRGRWIRPGESVRIQDSEISGGLFYLGAELDTPKGKTQTYAINPDLSAVSQAPDTDGYAMHHWPSYEKTSPAARQAFLSWMAGGRRHPSYGPSHPLLFFYGLEHRLFVDEGDDSAEVIAEVTRLLASYPQESTFRDRAERFIVLASIKAGVPLPDPTLKPEKSDAFYVDLAVRLHLGRALLNSTRLKADNALLWVINMPEVTLRAPAVRCFEELKALWRIKFDKRYPAGIEVRSDARIRLTYEAASGAFEVLIRGPHETYPDITRAVGWKDLGKLLEECTADLESLSRFLARNPDRRNSMQAALLLPPPLASDAELPALQHFEQEMHKVARGSTMAATTIRELIVRAGFDLPETGKLSGYLVDQVGSALDLINIAIEPDRRYGSGIPGLDDKIFIFKAERGGPVNTAKAEYQRTRLEIEVAALAAAADGTVSTEELEHVVQMVGRKPDLTRIEKARLIAFAAMIFESPPKQARILKKLADSTVDEKQQIADAAVRMIGTTDAIETTEVRFLENLHKSLGLPKERVYSRLHEESAKPAPAAASPLPTQRELPPSAVDCPEHLNINAVQLAKTQKDTAAVSALLSSIFTDEPVEHTPPPPSPPASAVFPGLDHEHGLLLGRVLFKDRMSRADFELLANEQRLLPDGAIERINEWAFDTFDEQLLEDEADEVVVIAATRELIGMQTKEAA